MKNKVLIGIAITVASSFTISLLTWYWGLLPWFITIPIFLVLLGSVSLIIYNKSFRRIGLRASSKKRGDSGNFKEVLGNAESTVDFLVSWGGSLPGLSSYWQREVSEMVNRGIKFRFLLLRPNSYGSVERRSRSAKWTQSDHLAVLNQLMLIKKERIESGHWDDFRVALYDGEACWSMAFVDGKTASIGFYGRGVGRDHPSLELVKSKNVGLFDFYRKTFEDIWSRASEKNSIHTVDDLENMLSGDKMRESKGLMYAFLGPCGAGKTTITNALLSKNDHLRQMTTHTTRKQRDKSENLNQYIFVDESQISAEGLINYSIRTKYCGNEYAISVENVVKWMHSSDDYVMDTIFDPEELRKVFKDRIVLIYLTSSKNQVMINRARARFSNNRSQLYLRYEHSKTVSSSATLCDYILYTDEDIGNTISKIEQIMTETRESYNQTGRIVSDKDLIKTYRSDNQIDTYGLPNDEAII